NLEEAVMEGRFRPDVYYRLNVVPVRVPSLRERRSDIPHLVRFFVQRFARKFAKNVETVSREAMDRLERYPWNGNIRELQNVIERAVVLSSGPVLMLNENLLPHLCMGSTGWSCRTRDWTCGRPEPFCRVTGRNRAKSYLQGS